MNYMIWHTHITQVGKLSTFTREDTRGHVRTSPSLKLLQTNALPITAQTARLLCCLLSPNRSEVKARQDVKPDFRHPPFTDYRQPPVDYRHPPVTDYRQPPTLDYRHPPGLLDFRQHPAAAQFPLGLPPDFRPQVRIDQEPSAHFNTVLTRHTVMPPHCGEAVGNLCFQHNGHTLLFAVGLLQVAFFFCRTMITSQWSWRKVQRVLASASAAAESTRWTYLCCALLKMVLPYVTEG